MTCDEGRVARHDIAIQRGDSAAVILRFHTVSQTGETRLLDLSECVLTLTIDWPGGRLVRSSMDGGLAVDVVEGTVSWRPVPAETQTIPEGRIAAYRLVREVADGERRTLIAGYLIGMGFEDDGFEDEGDASDV